MSSKERFLYIVIVFFGAYYLINMYSSNEDEYINKYNAKIEALEQKVDSLHHINDELTFKIDTLNVQISKLDQEIGLKDNKINNLRYEISTKVDAVDNFNDDELERFFTERYKKITSRQRQDTIN